MSISAVRLRFMAGLKDRTCKIALGCILILASCGESSAPSGSPTPEQVAESRRQAAAIFIAGGATGEEAATFVGDRWNNSRPLSPYMHALMMRSAAQCRSMGIPFSDATREAFAACLQTQNRMVIGR